MKKPIYIISTDKHLNHNNLDEFADLCNQEIKLAKYLNVKTIIWLGDIFDSRISQRQETLRLLWEGLQLYSKNDLDIYCIPGNHDKTDYSSSKSFLDVFKSFDESKSRFHLFDEPTTITLEGVKCDFIPFYSNEVWLDKFETLKESNSSLLFSHLAINGSINNDKTEVESSIKVSLFSKYKKVFLGHYHNQQQIGKNVFHLPSTYQMNYGEDEDKGFSIFYDDFSVDLAQSNFRHFKTLSFDFDTNTLDFIKKCVRESENSQNRVRFIVKGDADQLKTLDRSLFAIKGIDLLTKNKSIEIAELEEEDEITVFSQKDIENLFVDFCKKNNYKVEDGQKYLQ